MVETEHYEHEFYKHCDEKDAIAWAFVNKEKLVKFPFKFPALGAKEISLYWIMSHRRFSWKSYMG